MSTLPDNKFLKSALIYASNLDWAVFPLVPKTKRPITEHGFKDATKDEQQIIDWWTSYPNANIGIATGAVSGFFVLDVDPRNNGDETLEELLNHYRIFPDTVQAITGGGGSHYLYKYHEGIKSKEFMQGLDIKADGGYIVATPSIHPDSGKSYEWELSSRPIENEIAEAPEWLVNKILTPEGKTPIKKPSSYWMDIFNNTSEGNRNDNAASLTGYLLRRYVDPLLVGEIIQLWNTDKVQPPLETEELETVLRSIVQKEMKRRGAKI